jgi:hypothetical protein
MSNNIKSGSAALGDYSYLAPEGWQTYKTNNAIVLSQYQTLEYGAWSPFILRKLFQETWRRDQKIFFRKCIPGGSTVDRRES